METTDYGELRDCRTGEYIRAATKEEREASFAARKTDGGAGAILVDEAGAILSSDDMYAGDARRVYVHA